MAGESSRRGSGTRSTVDVVARRHLATHGRARPRAGRRRREVGDVCALPFDDALVRLRRRELDAVPRARHRPWRSPSSPACCGPGGRLVAATNSTRHLEELWTLVGRDKTTEVRHFFSRGRRGVARCVTSPGRADETSSARLPSTPRACGATSARRSSHKHLVASVPELTEPLVATRRCTVFVARDRRRPHRRSGLW